MYFSFMYKIKHKREVILCLFLFLVILDSSSEGSSHNGCIKATLSCPYWLVEYQMEKKTRIVSCIADGFLLSLRHCGCSEIRKVLCVLSFFPFFFKTTFIVLRKPRVTDQRGVCCFGRSSCAQENKLYMFSQK